VFITFEGIDGSGKSTQIEMLHRRLTEEGHRVHTFRDPGGTGVSEKIRETLLNAELDVAPVTEALLFSAARAQLIAEKVQPLLKKGDVVILDRFYDSTVAYQGYGRASLPLVDIHALNEIASYGLVPDLTFYLKIPVEEAQKRTASVEKDRMEKSGAEFYQNVIKGFNELAKSEKRFVAVDAAESPDQIHDLINKRVQKRL
jgi:dTMP kinase